MLSYPPTPLTHVGQHLEEVKFLNGTISRLKDKLAAAEKDATVAHMIKVQGWWWVGVRGARAGGGGGGGMVWQLLTWCWW